MIDFHGRLLISFKLSKQFALGLSLDLDTNILDLSLITETIRFDSLGLCLATETLDSQSWGSMIETLLLAFPDSTEP